MSAAQVTQIEAALSMGMSELGAIAAAVHDRKLVAVEFGHRDVNAAVAALRRRMATCRFAPATSSEPDRDAELAGDVLERLQRYAAGESVEFGEVAVASDHLSPFQRRVVKACRAIPRGEQRTYGQLAAAAGSAGAARAVGQVMAGNRTPLVVPCHRVVASGGGLGGFSAPEGLAMKRRLLDLEAAAAAT